VHFAVSFLARSHLLKDQGHFVLTQRFLLRSGC
jgi:hypothetical protein